MAFYRQRSAGVDQHLPQSRVVGATIPPQIGRKEDKAEVVAAEAEPATTEVEVDCPKCGGSGKVTKTKRIEASAPQLDILWKAGIPEPEKLPYKDVGWIIGRITKNNYQLPESLAYLRNKGEIEEREWKGAPKA